MRRSIFTFAVLLSSLCLFTACDLFDKDKGKNDSKNDYKNSQLTPTEHQAKLEEMAIEFVNYFNPADVEPLAESLMTLSEYIPVEEGNSEVVAALINDLTLGVKSFNPIYFTQFTTRVSEELVFDPYVEIFAELDGMRTTYVDGEWVAEEMDKQGVEIVWDNARINLTWDEGNVWEHDFVDMGVYYKVNVPKMLQLAITIDNVEHFAIAFTTKIPKSEDVTIGYELRLYGGYAMGGDASADTNGAKSSFYIKKDDKTLLAATAAVAAKNLTDYDAWFSYWYDEYEDYGEYYLDEQYFADIVKNGSMQFTLMDFSVIVSGDFRKLVDKIEEIDETLSEYDEDWNYSEEQAQLYYEALAKAFNDNAEAILVYNSTKEKIADVEVQMCESWYDEYDGTTYYGIEPVMIFPDGSRFVMEEFFTSDAFAGLLETIAELVPDTQM